MPLALFNRRRYLEEFDLFAILGNVNAMPVWHTGEWAKLKLALTPLLARAKLPARAYVSQNRHGEALREEFDWTHDFPLTRTESPKWVFQSMELWVPNRKECDAKNRPPDIFFGMRNEKALFPHKRLSFNPYIALAVRCGLVSQDLGIVFEAAKCIAQEARPVLKAHMRRPWGMPVGKDGFENAIGDLLVVDVFKVGAAHTQKPTLDTLEGVWEEF